MTDPGPGILPIGSSIGRYQVIRRLALGGMAELYLVRHLGEAGYEKVVALKRVLPHLAEDPTFVRMFLDEARLAAGLNHSAIAQVMDFGTEGGEHFMTLEYVHGRSVLQLMREAGRALSRAVALTIAHEVAGALHYAHERAGPGGRPLGLVHRDVSPSNILVSYDGDVKLVDFGIAKATAYGHGTQTAAIKGKIAYMAPEQLRGESLDRRSDVFALCVVLYEMLLGKRCFSAPGEFALINKVADAKYRAPSRVDPDIEPELEALLVEGLSAEPEARPRTARALQCRLEAAAAAHGIRLSKVGIGEFMEGTFGVVDYPRTDTLPLPHLGLESPADELAPVVASRPRASWPWVAAALGVGVGMVGIGVGMASGRAERPSAFESSLVPGSSPTSEPELQPEPVAMPVESPEPEPEVIIEAEPAPEPEVIIEVEPEPEPELPDRSRRSRAKKRRKKKDMPEPGLDPAFLPPSRRSG